MKLAKDPYWMKSGLYTMLQRIFNLLFGFGSFLVLVRVLDKSDFGAWALFITVTSLVEVARNGLVQNAQIKYLSGASTEDAPKIMAASLTLNTLVTLFSVLLLFAGGGALAAIWSAPKLQQMFYLYTLTTVCLIPFSQFNFIQQSYLDFKGIFWASFARQGFFFCMAVYHYLYAPGVQLQSLVAYQTIGAVLGSAVGYAYVRGYFRFRAALEWQWVKTLFHYGKYVFGTNISSTVYTSIDQMMLGFLLPTSAVAVFNAANRVTNFIEVPLSAVSAIVFPQSARRLETGGKEAVTYLYERSVGLLLSMIVPFVAVTVVFAKLIILIIAGERYLDAVPVLQIIMAATIPQPFVRQFGVAMDSMGKPKTNFALILFISAVNVGTNYLFISWLGLIGAAFGTLCALLIFLVISQLILRKELGIKFHHPFIYMWQFYNDGFALALSKVRREYK